MPLGQADPEAESLALRSRPEARSALAEQWPSSDPTASARRPHLRTVAVDDAAVASTDGKDERWRTTKQSQQ
ncbi:hypothetical protein GCM10025867_16400 [Frondihabitans sucicola]|uniref:Uncharacterized protein n=1 Tax=Frondihabitans sucicola TaxID=1268041 RepID=A0ABM8GMG4_9MICO|nr:hypothetical protein GCM10025867_16400 [Frondihabitans sucicola]